MTTCMTPAELERDLENLRTDNPRKAAEVAYVLAVLAKEEGDEEKAIKYGRESIQLFDQCSTDTQEDCAAVHTELAGVTLPDLIHQDVVRDRLKPLQL